MDVINKNILFRTTTFEREILSNEAAPDIVPKRGSKESGGSNKIKTLTAPKTLPTASRSKDGSGSGEGSSTFLSGMSGESGQSGELTMAPLKGSRGQSGRRFNLETYLYL